MYLGQVLVSIEVTIFKNNHQHLYSFFILETLIQLVLIILILIYFSHVTNKALRELRVKDEPSDVASQRLLLYCSAKNVLNTGMKLVGLSPLERM